MSTQVQGRLHKAKSIVLDWLMFALSFGTTIPQAASDGRVRTAAIETVRIPRTTRCPKACLHFSARAETMN